MDKESKGCDKTDRGVLKNENADLKKKVDEATARIKVLRDKISAGENTANETIDALKQYHESEKTALIDSIARRSDFKAYELKDKPVEELRIIHLAIDKANPPDGTVKHGRRRASYVA